jgi:NAD(P)H-hydrate epimerase
MEDASLRLWDALLPRAAALGAGKTGPLTALCGSGNNAGDALAMLRHARFSGLANLAVIMGTSTPGELPMAQLSYLRKLDLPILFWEAEPEACRSLLGRSLLLLDGIAGTGLHGSLREPLLSLLKAAIDCGRPVVAVDIPSGASDDFAPDRAVLPARWTLAIEPRKSVLYFPALRPFCGEIVGVGDIFPEEAATESHVELLEPKDLSRFIVPPSASSHKGSRGRVAVFAGSIGMTGAPALSSQAALVAGAGLVAVFASADILPILSAKLDAVMVKPEPEQPGDIEAQRWDAILLGPGWGKTERNKETLRRLLSIGLPMVIDADAIDLYGSLLSEGLKPSVPLVLTPHPGEFFRLTGIAIEEALANPAKALPAAARRFGAVLVLKSHCTWIASPDGRMAVWEGMESGLATAGSGDVLAGTAAGLLASAQKRRPPKIAADSPYDAVFTAACASVIAHGVAGRLARAAHGWFQASALIEEVGRVVYRSADDAGWNSELD